MSDSPLMINGLPARSLLDNSSDTGPLLKGDEEVPECPEHAEAGDLAEPTAETNTEVPIASLAGAGEGPEDMAAIIFRARKSPEAVAALVSTRKEFVAAPIVKTPPKGKYVRVREGEEWDYNSQAFLMLPADFGSDRREYLMIHPELEDFLQSKRQLRSVMKLFGLAFIVDAHGAPGFWALNLKDTGNWGTSARMIVEELKLDWGMVCADKNAYVLERPEDDLGDPLWPEGSVEHWLGKAFSDRLIDSEDHPEIKKLLGRK